MAWSRQDRALYKAARDTIKWEYFHADQALNLILILSFLIMTSYYTCCWTSPQIAEEVYNMLKAHFIILIIGIVLLHHLLAQLTIPKMELLLLLGDCCVNF